MVGNRSSSSRSGGGNGRNVLTVKWNASLSERLDRKTGEGRRMSPRSSYPGLLEGAVVKPFSAEETAGRLVCRWIGGEKEISRDCS